MTQKRRSRVRSSLFYVLPALALFSLATVAATRPVPSNSTAAVQAAVKWVEAHRADLPTTLEEIAALPFAHRRMVIASLPVAQRKEVWRQHLQVFVTPDSEKTPLQRQIASGLSKPLSQEQVAFLRAEIDSLESTFRDDLTAAERSEKSGGACARSRAILGVNDARLTMVGVGGVDDSYVWAFSSATTPVRFHAASVAGTMTLALRAAATRLGVVPAAFNEPCFCHQMQYCECPNATLCVQNWPPCEPATICGWCCGCQGMQQCNGSKCTL